MADLGKLIAAGAAAGQRRFEFKALLEDLTLDEIARVVATILTHANDCNVDAALEELQRHRGVCLSMRKLIGD